MTNIFQGRTLVMNLLYVPRIIVSMVFMLPIMLISMVIIFILSHAFPRGGPGLTLKETVDPARSLVIIVFTNQWDH